MYIMCDAHNVYILWVWQILSELWWELFTDNFNLMWHMRANVVSYPHVARTLLYIGALEDLESGRAINTKSSYLAGSMLSE